MRIVFSELMEKLGVGYDLSPYETCPWLVYDSEKGITCSAEVRAGPDLSDIEAELQFLYDEGVVPSEDEDEEEEEGDGEEEQKEDPNAWRDSLEEIEKRERQKALKPQKTKGFIPEGPRQIFFLRIIPTNDGRWMPVMMFLKGEDFVNKINNWEGKARDFFRSCIEAMLMDELPDIEELIEKELDDERWGGRGKRGKIGKKSPKIKPAALLGMKP